MYILTFLFSLVVIFLIGIFFTCKDIFKGKKLSKHQKRYFQSKIKGIYFSEKTPREKIIDFDICVHKILITLGYTGSFGDILKQKPKEIIQGENLWRLHKIRNKLVHEEILYSEKSLKIYVSQYEKYIVSLLKSL